MTWDDDRDFVDDFVDGLTSGLTPGVTLPTTKTVASTPAAKLSPAVASIAGTKLASIADVLKPAPSTTPVTPSSSLALHTPLATITTPVQKALGPAGASGAAQAFQTTAAKVGGADVILSTPGAAPHVETPPVADFSARLSAIRGALLAIRAQTEATSQHRGMMRRDDFRRNVIARLSRIESRLPVGSAAADQIRTVKVLLG
jgi:hypothetical protein